MRDLDHYRPMMPMIEDTCEYRYIGSDFINVKNYDAREILTIAPEGISYLTARVFQTLPTYYGLFTYNKFGIFSMTRTHPTMISSWHSTC